MKRNSSFGGGSPIVSTFSAQFAHRGVKTRAILIRNQNDTHVQCRCADKLPEKSLPRLAVAINQQEEDHLYEKHHTPQSLCSGKFARGPVIPGRIFDLDRLARSASCKASRDQELSGQSG